MHSRQDTTTSWAPLNFKPLILSDPHHLVLSGSVHYLTSGYRARKRYWAQAISWSHRCSATRTWTTAPHTGPGSTTISLASITHLSGFPVFPVAVPRSTQRRLQRSLQSTARVPKGRTSHTVGLVLPFLDCASGLHLGPCVVKARLFSQIQLSCFENPAYVPLAAFAGTSLARLPPSRHWLTPPPPPSRAARRRNAIPSTSTDLLVSSNSYVSVGDTDR